MLLFAHIFVTRNFKKIQNNIKYFIKPALNFEKGTRPEKDSATRLWCNEYQETNMLKTFYVGNKLHIDNIKLLT